MPVPRSDPTRRLPPGARRAALLELLREHDRPMGIAELAPMIGLHPNTVRAHLDALARAGQVTRRTDARPTPGRPRDLYEATGAPATDRNYRLLAEVLATSLTELSQDSADLAAGAGRRWAASRPTAPGAPASRPSADLPPSADPDSLAPVMRMLRTNGFAPALAADGSAIELHHCPFRELAVQSPEVVCGLHLGLIQGTLARSGPTVAATRILPFVQPDLCLAQLERL